VQTILKESKINGDRVRFVQFVTVMLADFVNQINNLAEAAKTMKPIPAEALKRLSRDMDNKLFG